MRLNWGSKMIRNMKNDAWPLIRQFAMKLSTGSLSSELQNWNGDWLRAKMISLMFMGHNEVKSFMNSHLLFNGYALACSWKNSKHVKGKTKLKRFFQADISIKKRKKQILFCFYETSGRLVFVRFLEEIEDTKKKFRN